jgi:hypothetical protein
MCTERLAVSYVIFLDDMGERSFKWRKWKGKWQFGWQTYDE